MLLMLADFFAFDADYFEKGKLNGEDMAAGEIWLGNRVESNYNYHFIGVWPHSVNFGELCYSSNPYIDLEIKLSLLLEMRSPINTFTSPYRPLRVIEFR